MAAFASGLVSGYTDEANKKRDKGPDVKKATSSAQKYLSSAAALNRPSSPGAALNTASPGQYKRGGKVRKTGFAKVHKGERVLTAKQAHKRRKMSRR